jgi:hypothetical protein
VKFCAWKLLMIVVCFPLGLCLGHMVKFKPPPSVQSLLLPPVVSMFFFSIEEGVAPFLFLPLSLVMTVK